MPFIKQKHYDQKEISKKTSIKNTGFLTINKPIKNQSQGFLG